MKFDTRLVAYDPAPGDDSHPAVTPIYQTATFRQESASEFGAYDYSRSGNPTRSVLETQLAVLEDGSRAFAFTSGLAAITAVTRLLKPGEEILACDDLYGGTYRLFSRILTRREVEVRYVDFSDLTALEESITPQTRLIYLETPTNPLLKVIDIARTAEIAHRHGALVCVDNSTLSPYLQQPLRHGADIVIHSATKFLCGHSDVTAGAVVVKDAEVADELYLIQNGEGAGLPPLDSFLLLRGMKTLAVRLDRQQQNATKVAHFLRHHPAVTRVNFPGLLEGTDRAIYESQARGPGAVISFETGDAELSKMFAEACKIINITVSFGGVNSTISLPNYMSHASIPPVLRERKRLPLDLVRLSVGIEDADDVIDDLTQALQIPVLQEGEQYSQCK
jgi:cysteine-S-conjugate beta-lyase